MATIIVPLNNGNKIICRAEEVRAVETFTRPDTPKLFWVRLHLDGSMDFANGRGSADDDFIDIPFKSEENRDAYFDDIAAILEGDDSGDADEAIDNLRSLN